MEVTETGFEGLFVLKPKIFYDERGYFFESYNRKKFKELGITNDFVQDNESKSNYGTIRGLHFQKGEFAQAKLVRCLSGKILDVALDIRENSKTFGKYFSIELTDENKLQFLLPRGFAHGFSVLSDVAVFAYKCDNFYNKESEGGILWNSVGIDWKIETGREILSEKDKNHQTLDEFIKKLRN